MGSWFTFSGHPAAIESHVARFRVSSRSSTDRGNTRSVSRAQLVPLRFYWSTKTRPVPPRSFYPSLLRMMSFRVSPHQRQHLPLSSPLSPPRFTAIADIPPTPPLVLSVVSSHYCNNYCSSNVKNLILAPPQVTKASSTKPGPAAITSATAANQTASITGAKHSLVNFCMGFEIT